MNLNLNLNLKGKQCQLYGHFAILLLAKMDADFVLGGRTAHKLPGVLIVEIIIGPKCMVLIELMVQIMGLIVLCSQHSATQDDHKYF